MPRQLKVFLCHAHSDKDAVKTIYARLKREGVDVWLDKEKLLPGADWEYEIRKAVRESDVVIVCLSKQFSQAGFRQKEVRIALEEADKKPPGEIFIIPARLEECDNLESLSKWHWVDLFESDGFQRLIIALRIRADKIGAALRQRGGTVSRQKRNEEQQDAEKDRIEKGRQIDEEQKQQSLAKEQADREAAEKAEHERLARLKAEQEKADRERLERTAAENAERERLARLKAKQEKAEREAVEANRQIRNLRSVGFAGIIILLLILGGFGLNSLFKKLPEATSTTTSTVFTETFKLSTETSLPFTPTLTDTPALITTPTLGIGSTMISEKDSMVMVYVPEGKFKMGYDWELQEVYLDAYWIDQTEVTNAMYRKCVEEGNCSPPTSARSFSTEGYYYEFYDDYPVIFVNWNQAKDYCTWIGDDLPTDAQWEKAARGTDGRIFPWGSDDMSCDRANYYDFSEFCIGDTTKVGSYNIGKSPYGLYDMLGNVSEWVRDWYDDSYNYYDNLPLSNPLGPNSGEYRVIRGGSWSNYPSIIFRDKEPPLSAGFSIGFRCAMDATP